MSVTTDGGGTATREAYGKALAELGQERQDIVVLDADLSGSTALYEKLGNAAAKTIVQAALRRMAEIVVLHRGRVVKNIGDEVLCCFETAETAAGAAIQMQLEDELRIGGE